MTDLSPAQLTFLQDHLNYDARGMLKKRALRKQLQEFWRRRDKAQVELNALPPAHPQRAAIEKGIADATKKAEDGKLKAAYADLKSIKESARAAATVVKNGVNLGVIRADITTAVQKAQNMMATKQAVQDSTDNQSQTLITRANAIADPATGANRDEILKLLGAAQRQKLVLIGAMDALESTTEQSLATYSGLHSNAPVMGALLDLIAHNIGLFNLAHPGELPPAIQGDLMSVDGKAKTHFLTGNGGELRAEVTTMLRDRRVTLLDILATKTTPPQLEASQSTDHDGKALTGDEAIQAQKDMAERFKIAEDLEKERWAAAQERYREDVLKDNFALNLTEGNVLIQPSKTLEFSTVDFFDDLDIDLTDTDKTPDEIGQTAGKGISDALAVMLADMSALPDEAYEMCTRGADDWMREAAIASGVNYDPKRPNDTDPEVFKRLKAAADAMNKAAFEAFPNKASFDDMMMPTEFTLDGVKYDDIKFLSRGGGGKVFIATHPASGEQVVLKTPIAGGTDAGDVDPEAHASFREEALNHRAATGGETGECSDNILDMKGIVLAPSGLPMIVMDLADAGDAEGYSDAMSACEDSGLISDVARQAMMAEQMRDMIKGLQVMQQSGMTHHDLKEANVFLSSDGSFKIADFGLARHVGSETEGVVEMNEFTAGYQPPEIEGEGDVTQKSDNFTLGEILDRITDPMRGQGGIQEGFSSMQAAKGQKVDAEGKVTSASSLDRLVNALKETDPDKRPTLDAVLMSSYFDDMDSSYRAEDVDRLKVASAEYAKTAGRKTAKISEVLNRLKGQLQRLEWSKTDALVEAEIANLQKVKAERQSKLTLLEKRRAIAFGEDDIKDLDHKIAEQTRTVNNMDDPIRTAQQKLGATKDSVDIEKINAEMETVRKDIIQKEKEIKAIHDDPQYAAIVKELDEANAAFV